MSIEKERGRRRERPEDKADLFDAEAVLSLYERTAGGSPEGRFPWGLGPASKDDLRTAVVNACAAGDLTTTSEPWSLDEANVIRDYLVGLVRSRRPLYRVAVVAEVDTAGQLRGEVLRIALVYDEDGIADNWKAAEAQFRRYVKGTGPALPRVDGLSRTTVSRNAARLSMSKRTLQRRRDLLRRHGIDPDGG